VGGCGRPLTAHSLEWLSEHPDQRELLSRDRDALLRHFSFGIGVHRCVGSNVARTVFKSMLTAVLDRMPDYRCDPGGTVHYTSIGVIQGMRYLPATFTPGTRIGAGLDETLDKLPAHLRRTGTRAADHRTQGRGGRRLIASARPGGQPLGRPSTRWAMMFR
jgi:hypothetical protein